MGAPVLETLATQLAVSMSGDGTWQSCEAVLFAVRALAQDTLHAIITAAKAGAAASPGNAAVSAAGQALLQALFSAIAKPEATLTATAPIITSAVLCLRGYTQWIAAHPELVDGCTMYAIQALKVPAAASAASIALRTLAHKAVQASGMVGAAPTLARAEVVEAMLTALSQALDSGSLTVDDAAHAANGIQALIRALPTEVAAVDGGDGNAALTVRLVAICLQRTTEALAHREQLATWRAAAEAGGRLAPGDEEPDLWTSGAGAAGTDAAVALGSDGVAGGDDGGGDDDDAALFAHGSQRQSLAEAILADRRTASGDMGAVDAAAEGARHLAQVCDNVAADLAMLSSVVAQTPPHHLTPLLAFTFSVSTRIATLLLARSMHVVEPPPCVATLADADGCGCSPQLLGPCHGAHRWHHVQRGGGCGGGHARRLATAAGLPRACPCAAATRYGAGLGHAHRGGGDAAARCRCGR